MKLSKVIVSLIAAEILCFFIDLTLAGSSNPLIRVICAICTAGILCVLLANTAINAAREDMKQERITGKSAGYGGAALAGAVCSAPALISWIVLLVSANSGKPDFYRWHKLINAPFLQVYNLIEPDASTSALSTGEIMLMLPLVIVPAAAFVTAYILACRDVTTAEK